MLCLSVSVHQSNPLHLCTHPSSLPPPPPCRIINRPSHNKSGLLGLFLSFVPLSINPSSCHHITSPRIAHRIASQLPSVDLSASRPVRPPIDFFFLLSSPSHLDKTIDFFLFCRAETIRFDTIRLLLCISWPVSAGGFLIFCIRRHFVLLSPFGAAVRGDKTSRGKDRLWEEAFKNTTNDNTPRPPLQLPRHRPARHRSSLQLDSYPALLLVCCDRQPKTRKDKTQHSTHLVLKSSSPLPIKTRPTNQSR